MVRQQLAATPKNIPATIAEVVRSEGPFALYRGFAAAGLRELSYFRRADIQQTDRGDTAAATWIFRGVGDAAAATWICRGEQSRLRRGRDVDMPR